MTPWCDTHGNTPHQKTICFYRVSPVERPSEQELPRRLREVRLVLVGLQSLVDDGLEPSGPCLQIGLNANANIEHLSRRKSVRLGVVQTVQWNGATIAQWIRLCLPSCGPEFESQACHLRFSIYSHCVEKRTKINLAHILKNCV